MSDASWVYSCHACGHRVALDSNERLDCPKCGACGALVADDEAGGTPSEGHAGLRRARVPLEKRSEILGAEQPGLGSSYARPPTGTPWPDMGPSEEGSDEDELPITAWVAARRWTRKYKRFIKGYAGRLRHLPCFECAADCVIEDVTFREREAASERGERWEILCDECKKVVAPDVAEGMTEAQAEKMLRNALIADSQMREN